MSKILYIDLDDTLADYSTAAKQLNVSPKEAKHIKGFFRNLKPVKDAIEAYQQLEKYFDIYILSTSPWSNPEALTEKLEWVKQYFPNAYKNVIFTHHKDLNIGDYLIDDSLRNGASKFKGEHIQFGSDKFKDWKAIIKYLLERELQ